MSGTATLFQGTFTSGTVTNLGKNYFHINAGSSGFAFTLNDRHGDVTTNTIVTPDLARDGFAWCRRDARKKRG